MTEQRPFRVEVSIDAPRDAVWRALTDPKEIRRWFGWDYDGLDDEIRYIFVDHATPAPPRRIALEGEQTIELEADGPRTIVRVSRPGPPSDAGDGYDDMEEGWRAFLVQLRYYLERHPSERRRTVFLQGEAPPAKVVAALDATVPGRLWHAGRYQRAIAVDGSSADLVVVEAPRPLESDSPGRVTVTVTSFGLDDTAFERLRREWESWWATLADHATVTA